MQSSKLPAARGWFWIAEGFALLRRNPPMLTFLVFGYWFVLLAIDLVPYVGVALASVCVPALSMGIMNGCRAIERGAPLAMGTLFSGFDRNLRALLTLGVVYFGATLLILAATTLVDDGALMAAMRGRQNAGVEAVRSASLMQALQFALLLMVPVLMAFWFAPMLAAWNGFPVVKALFFSFFASLRNWRAFLVYALVLTLVSAVIPGLVLGLSGLFSPGAPQLAMTLLTLPLLFVFVPTLFASFYVSYRDVFGGAADAAD